MMTDRDVAIKSLERQLDDLKRQEELGRLVIDDYAGTPYASTVADRLKALRARKEATERALAALIKS